MKGKESKTVAKHMALFSDYPKATVKKAREMGHTWRIEKVSGPAPFRYLFYTLDRADR